MSPLRAALLVSVVSLAGCASRAAAPGPRATEEPRTDAASSATSSKPARSDGWLAAVASGERSPSVAAKSGNPSKDQDFGESFPAHDVRTALRAAKGGLRSCGEATPQALKAILLFEPSGKVGKVDVTPAGAAASCVEKRLGEVSVGPFQGEPVTVVLPVDLAAR